MRYWYVILLFVSATSSAQNWTLKQCTDTALANNTSIRSAQIDASISAINIKSSKQRLLPSLNGSASQGYNFGQTIDPFTNEFATNRVQYNNFYLSSNVSLFNGLQNYYGIKINEIDYQSKLLNKAIEERNLKMKIAASYMQILLNNELLEASKEQLIFTESQIKKTQGLIIAQNKTKNDLLEIQAQKANDNYLVLKSQNNLNYSLLLLQQLLGMKYDSLFAIESSDTIFEARINQNQFDYRNLSEMELAELKLEKQSIKIKSIKGKFYPTLSLNGSLGSGYSENRKYLTPQGDWLPTPFGSQITENFYQSASVSLSIPIFNKNTTRTELQINALELKKLELNKEQQGLDVINKLEQLKMDVSNAKALFKSSLVVLESVKLNYDNYLFQYENSIINYNQLLETKDKLYQAQSKLIQAKYQMKFKKLLFEIYTY